MKALSDKAAGESRDLTTEEYVEYNRMDADLRSKGSEIERLEREEGIAPGLTREAAQPSVDAERVGAESNHGELRKRVLGGDKAALRDYIATGEYRDAFEAVVRKRGDVRSVSSEHRAALNVTTNAEGGFLVPDEFYRQIVKKATEVSNVRPYATVVTTGDHGDLLIPKEDGDLTVTWLAEAAAYTQSEPTFAQSILGAFKAGLIAKASDEMLSDPFFDILGYLSGRIGRSFGKETNAKYVNGTSGSTTTPEGFINKATTGKTGATGQTLTVTGDDIIDLYHSVIDPYRSNGRWYMRDASVKVVRKLKDADNQYLWQPGLQAGQPDVILGRPLVVTPDVPAMAANAKSIAFGDLSGYWIRDVQNLNIKILNELYAANGQVGVRADLRTDGDLIDTDSVKVYANSAT